MSALSRRLLRTTKTIDRGLLQQNWRFTPSPTWTVSASNTIAALSTGTTGAWVPLLPSDKKRNVADGKKYYFEVKISNNVQVVDSTCLRIGVFDGTRYHVFTANGSVPVGTSPHGSSFYSDWRLYTDSTRQPETVYRWDKGDTIGCSIENVGGNTVVRFYINGVDPSFDGRVASTIIGTPDIAIGGSGWRIAGRDDYIEMQIMDLKYLPNGFEPW